MSHLPGNHPPQGLTASFSTPFHTFFTRLHPSQARLRWLTLRPRSEGAQLEQVEAEAREHHLHVNPGRRGHQQVTRMEHALDHGEGPLHRRPLPVDVPVPQPVQYAQRVASGPTPHRRRDPPGLHAEVRLVQVHHLAGPGQVHPAVVDAGRRRLQVPDEATVDVGLGVQLVPEAGPASLLGPRAVPAPPSLRLVSPGLPRQGRGPGRR